jgi:hypothetical protein
MYLVRTMTRIQRWWRRAAAAVGRGRGAAGHPRRFPRRPPPRPAAPGPATRAGTASWDFDVFEVPSKELPLLLLSFFEGLGLVRGPDHRATIEAFLTVARRHYSSRNAYHNFHHCADVTHATFMMLAGIRGAVSDLECYALLLAAVAHDLEHPGVSNAYLIKSRSPLAITYNDASVLENRHAACFFELIARYVCCSRGDRAPGERSPAGVRTAEARAPQRACRVSQTSIPTVPPSHCFTVSARRSSPSGQRC